MILLRKGAKPSLKRKSQKKSAFALPAWLYIALALGACAVYTHSSWEGAWHRLIQGLPLLQGSSLNLEALHHRVAFLEKENDRLRMMMGFIKGKAGKRVLAPVETDPSRSWNSTFVIGAGADQGIRLGQVVFDHTGVWGRIKEVTRKRAVVMMLTHPQCCIPVEGLKTQCQGIAYGTGQQVLRLELSGSWASQCHAQEIFVSACYDTPGAAGHTLGRLSQDRQHIITTLAQRRPTEVWVVLGSPSA